MSKSEQLLQALPSFTREELAQVSTRLSALLGTPVQVYETHPVLEELVYNQLASALRVVLSDVPKFGAFRARHPKYKDFREQVGHLIRFVKKEFRAVKRTEQIQAIGHIMGVLVRNRVNLRKEFGDKAQPLTMFSIVSDMQNVREILEKNFPGYIQSGLLRMILRNTAK